jgi:hypothetical protein
MIWVVAALLILHVPATAQEASAHEPLNDAWWTGPLLAPSANTLPKGHILVEPYFYDVTTQGFYDSTGTKRSAPHANSYGSLTYINYGLADKFTVGLIPTFGYNEVSNGPSGSGVGVGDLTVQAQYRLHLFQEKGWIPTISIAVQETLPSGKYDELGNRPSNGLGGGAFTTTLALYTQTFFWMPNGRILRMRVNVAPAFSHSVGVEGVSVYGTDQGFSGLAKPGNSIFVDAAWEYSLTQRWVLALDATYRNQANTHIAGLDKVNPSQPIVLNSGSSRAFGFAPAIEYNLNSKIGIIFGTRLFPAARNTSATITPAIAINIVR